MGSILPVFARSGITCAANGMDPVGIHELRELFRMLSKEYGMTLLISSHILQEIEQVADTIGVIHQGRWIEEVSMERVRGQQSEYIEIATTDGKQAAFIGRQARYPEL